MQTTPLRTAFVVELLGSFAFVFVVAGVICVNQVTQPTPPSAGQAYLYAHQPGLVGIALAQGLMFAALLSVTLLISPGCLNPAIVLMNWVLGRLATDRMLALLAAQLVGGVLAGGCVRFTFADEVLRAAHVGTPHWNELIYRGMTREVLLTATLMELALTFFLVLVILGALREGPRTAAWAGGAALTALTLIGFPLTGAALNPTRWLGTVFWELSVQTPEGAPSPFADVFVYAAGPVLGALLAGIVHARVIVPALAATSPAEEMAGKPAESSKAVRAKK